MNYRHAYHAGGIADVFKHVLLIALLDRLMQKESAVFALDTHAGIGLYDLAGVEASKTGEFADGINRLFGKPPQSPLLQRYLDLVAVVNPDDVLRFYPGSPLVMVSLLRSQDRGAFCELHPEDVTILRQSLRGHANAAVHYRDGYEALGAFLPPKERRALVLIDPPFENTGELDQAAAALAYAHQRMPSAVLAFWYPVKERPALWRFQEAMIASGIRKQLIVEFLTGDETDSRVLSGSGMLLINPPFGLETELRPALDELHLVLAPDGRIAWQMLVGE